MSIKIHKTFKEKLIGLYYHLDASMKKIIIKNGKFIIFPVVTTIFNTKRWLISNTVISKI